MTVADLIRQLQAAPQDAVVVIPWDGSIRGYADADAVRVHDAKLITFLDGDVSEYDINGEDGHDYDRNPTDSFKLVVIDI